MGRLVGSTFVIMKNSPIGKIPAQLARNRARWRALRLIRIGQMNDRDEQTARTKSLFHVWDEVALQVVTIADEIVRCRSDFKFAAL